MKPFLNNVGGKSKSDITYLNGGFNACNDQTEIQDNQLVYMKNLSLSNSPTLRTRSNRESIAYHMNDKTNFGNKPTWRMFSSSSNTLYTIEDDDTTTNATVYKYVVENDITKKYYIGEIERNDYRIYSICECRDSSNIYIFFSSLEKVYKYIESDPLLPGQFSMVNVDHGTLVAHKNRLWTAEGNTVKYSNLQDFDNFTIDPQDPVNTAGEIQLTNSKGGIMGAISFDGKLIVLCANSWHIIYGSTPNPQLSDSFYVVDMNDDIGCCSPKAYTVCDGALYWMDNECNVYRYNGASIIKVSEPYGNDNYAQYGGIKNFRINKFYRHAITMSSYDNYLYIIVTHTLEYGIYNDTILVYDTRNRVWQLEDSNVGFVSMANWEDKFLAGCLTKDILWMNKNNYKSGTDKLFNSETREFDDVPIEYAFETKTWLLNSVKNKKTLTNIWFQASADAVVSVHDSWTHHIPGEPITLLHVGHLKPANSHDITHPNSNYPEGTERQRIIIPKMYLQKVNAFAIYVSGTGYAEFHLIEKEWRIR